MTDHLVRNWVHMTPPATELYRLGLYPTPGLPTLWTPSMLLNNPPRPSGVGYVRYEDLYVTGDDLKAVVYKVPLSGGKRQVLTLPEGLFEITDFTDGYYNGILMGTGGAGGCRGIVGSGRNTIIRPKANSATRNSLGGNIAGTLMRWEATPGAEIGNFQLQGTAQSLAGQKLYYGGIICHLCHDSDVGWIYGVGANPGYAQFPPGETFGINAYQSHRFVIHDTEMDGRNTSGVRDAACPAGWNGSGMADPVLDAKIIRCYFHHAIASMPTAWKTKNFYTEDLWVYSNGISGNPQSGHGINHEQVWGHIEHNRPSLFTNGLGATDPTHTANNGLHFSCMYKAPAGSPAPVVDPLLDFTIREPVGWDNIYGTTGMMLMAAYNTYTLGAGAGDGLDGSHPNLSGSMGGVPKIIVNGVQLLRSDGQGSGWASKNKYQYFGWAH